MTREFFEQNDCHRKGKKTDARANRKIISRVIYYSQVTRRKRGIPSSFLAHLYALVIKSIHQNGNQRIAGTVEALLPRRASGTV